MVALPTRTFMESRFGRDFSAVRIHTGSDAATSAQALRARAYTIGPNIVFGSGQYSPSTTEGQRLLAHELAHVVQQSGSSPASRTHAAAASSVSQPGDAAEREADVVSSAVVDGRSFARPREASAPIARDAKVFIPAPAAGSTPATAPSLVSPPQLPVPTTAPPNTQPKDELKDVWKAGLEINLPGLIQTKDGANLHPEPNLTTTITTLPFNTRVWVERSVPDFYFIVTDGGSYGYVQIPRVTTDLPDPGSRLYEVQAGEGALAIVKKFYKANAQQWGQDERFFVNVLVFANQDKQRNGIYKPDPGGDWDTTATKAGSVIWIPSVEYAQAVKGKVSSGSMSYEVWSTVKLVASAIGEFLAGSLAFSAGILHGALESVWDTLVGIVDLVGLIWKFLKSLFTGNLLSDIKALWDDVSKIDFNALVQAGLDYLDKKWNDPSVWKRWHFRGWIIGYAIAELIMLFFSDGILTAIKVSAKAGKIGELIAKFPSVVKFFERAGTAAKDLQETKLVTGTLKALGTARDWAVKVLKIPFTVVGELTAEAIARLKKLPAWAQELFADLADAVKIRLLGCASPCKVDLVAIQAYLAELAVKGTAGLKKLTTVDEVLAALPKDLNISKIRPYLEAKPALMKVIQKAGLTDKDFVKLADFMTGADRLTGKTAYETFTKYLTRVVPAKLGPDVKAFNELLEAMIIADAKQGAALKGPMFEAFVRVHVPEFAGKAFERVTFRAADGTMKTADRFFADLGEMWEIKHQLTEVVPKEQVAAYLASIGSKTSAGAEIKSIHYLFPTEEAAKLNKALKLSGINVWYLKPPAILTKL